MVFQGHFIIVGIACGHTHARTWTFPGTRTGRSCLDAGVLPEASGTPAHAFRARPAVPYRGFLQAVKQVVVLGFKAGAGFAHKGRLVLRGLLT